MKKIRKGELEMTKSKSWRDRLESAIKKDDILTVKNMMENEPKDDFMKTALHCAAGLGKVSILEMLLDNGANVNERDSFATPFSKALFKKEFKAADFLFSRGADIENPDDEDLTDFLYICYDNGKIEQAEFLIEKGANIHQTCTDGKNGLFYSLEDNNLSLFTFLVEKGLDLNIEDKNGKSLVEIAIDEDYDEFLAIFLINHELLNDKNKRIINAYRLEKIFN
jgi:ankyrin repeat protein